MNTKNIALCLGRAARLPRAWPGTERGESVGPHTTRNTPTLSPKTQKRVLGPERTATLPRPAPALSGGSTRQKHAETPQNQPKRLRKRKNQSTRKPQTSKTRKTEAYRAQRRCENQLSTAAPRDLSTLPWTPPSKGAS